MSQLSVNLWVAVVITTLLKTDGGRPRSSAPARDSPVHTSRGCVYSFQVWTPNQDVLAKLRRLDERCDAVRSSVDHEVSLHRALR